MLTTRIPKTRCPFCARPTSAASSLTSPNERPVPGDLVVCIECAGVSRLTQTLGLVTLTDAELRELDPRELDDVARTSDVLRRSRGGREPS